MVITMTEQFVNRQKEYQQEIERELERALPSLSEQPYGVMGEAMRYAVLGGGKRLRGMLCLEFSRIFSNCWRSALPMAAAVELVHAYSLVHDDLPCMDNDTLRRGKPCCHVRYGEANALLAGDALLTRAFEHIAAYGGRSVGATAALACVMELSGLSGVSGMIGGQTVDLLLESADTVSQQQLQTLHTLKTGALIQAAVVLGAIAGGASQGAIALCRKFALAVGLAFQIVDDVLDCTSTQETLGKNIGSDKEQGKTTYVTLRGEAGAMQLAEHYLEEARQTLVALDVTDPFLQELCSLILKRKN